MQKILERKATTYGGRNGLTKDTQSGLMVQLSKPVEMGGIVNSNTNPEELFSMGYSSCFASSLEYLLQSSQTPYTNIKVSVITSLVPDGSQGFKFDVVVDAHVEGLNQELEKEMIEKAYLFCPFSKAIRNNVSVLIK
jgi:osmotically inducible protein OsmC